MPQTHQFTRQDQRLPAYRPTADELRAARSAEAAGTQGRLKQEAAARRAKREQPPLPADARG